MLGVTMFPREIHSINVVRGRFGEIALLGIFRFRTVFPVQFEIRHPILILKVEIPSVTKANQSSQNASAAITY